jgi:hypothetical protein
MRKLIIAGTLACLAVTVVQPVQAETWYLRNPADPTREGVAAPLQYCLRAIAAGGGACARSTDQVGARIGQERPSQRSDPKERRNRWVSY